MSDANTDSAEKQNGGTWLWFGSKRNKERQTEDSLPTVPLGHQLLVQNLSRTTLSLPKDW